MQLRVATETDRGFVREINEDSLIAEPPLLAVADGVGGHNAGEVASALAVGVLTQWIPTLVRDGGKKLQDAASDAHRRIYTRAQQETALHGMATTLTAAWIDAGTCTIAHVRDGRITLEEAYEHPWRNMVVQALGGQPEVVVEMLSIDLSAGDRLVLASDGLTDQLRPEQVGEILQANEDAVIACRTLVERAKQAGGTDNITVVLVDVTGDGEPEDVPPERKGRLRRLLPRRRR
ncbi:MAG: protein phosphatase 2C domain-containing protein [Actinomycetota bacterium]